MGEKGGQQRGEGVKEASTGYSTRLTFAHQINSKGTLLIAFRACDCSTPSDHVLGM